MYYQRTFKLKPYSRGFHLITREIEEHLSDLSAIEVGMANIFIKHTSASLTLNENADPTVRSDFERHMNKMVPENAPYFEHTYEGPDDMPAHIKSSLMGASVSVPVTNGRLHLGTWQGIYLCEHRNHASSREIVVTVMGGKKGNLY
ncbi:secondary thiamine-phosphate synthase enzyme YjbQ [Limibacter armeniacum]|uniref:secondary thiamine-phosphate synthase enzyme YjbQ n=1 Tax=Limibacter armeniacum TaxID=466084 RepID=UPI002FE667B8